MSNLYFGILLAPYRVDYYNYLHDELDYDIYFQQRTFEGQLFDSDELERACTFSQKYLSKRHIFWKIYFYKGLFSLIKSHKPVVVIAPEFSFLTVNLISLKHFFKIFYGIRFKVVSQCDDSYDMVTGGTNFSKAHIYARKIVVPLLDDLILVDSKTVQWYQEKYGKGRWMPIIQNESRKTFYPNELIESARRIRESYRLCDKFTILFVARFIELKNLPVLLKACSKFSQPYRLLIVGDGEMKSRWMNLAKDLKVEAVFVGKKNGTELDAFYYASDIFVLPSVTEPFGAVTNEALLNGCICVISKVAGSSCLIDEGENGFTFDPSSESDLIDKINQAALLSERSLKLNRMIVSFEDQMKKAFVV